MGSSRMNVRDFSEWDESDVRVRPNKKGSRPRTKDRPTFKEAIRGRVITVDRGRWSVVVDEGTEKERTLIAARAKELRRTAIVTGDFVDLVGVIGATAQNRGALAQTHNARQGILRAGGVTHQIHKVTGHNRGAAQLLSALCVWASAPRFCAVAPMTPTRRSAWSWRMLSSW